jgi:hypothetical protein
MRYALAAIGVGSVGYFALLIFQSPQSRRDQEAWGDLLFVSGVLTAFLMITMFLGMFEHLSDATIAAIVEDVLWKRSSGLLRPWALLSFAALPFTALAAVHVLVLATLDRQRRRNAA